MARRIRAGCRRGDGQDAPPSVGAGAAAVIRRRRADAAWVLRTARGRARRGRRGAEETWRRGASARSDARLVRLVDDADEVQEPQHRLLGGLVRLVRGRRLAHARRTGGADGSGEHAGVDAGAVAVFEPHVHVGDGDVAKSDAAVEEARDQFRGVQLDRDLRSSGSTEK